MIPRHPTAADVRADELGLLERLVTEQRQPEVRPWSRWDRFLYEIDRAGYVRDMRYPQGKTQGYVTYYPQVDRGTMKAAATPRKAA